MRLRFAGAAVALAVVAGIFGREALSRGTGVHPLRYGAITYYDGACAHCHGPYGSAYDETFFAKYDLAKLSQKIKQMADGPGQSPLNAEGLSAQTAFHQAIISRTPFIDWTSQSGGALAGEVTRKAVLSARARGAAVPVNVTGARWSLTLPSGATPADLTLTASLKGKTTVWRPTKNPFSLPSNWPPKPVK